MHLTTVPKIPLMNLWESSFENFLLISTASLIDTLSGIVSLYNISERAIRKTARSTFAIRESSNTEMQFQKS